MAVLKQGDLVTVFTDARLIRDAIWVKVRIKIPDSRMFTEDIQRVNVELRGKPLATMNITEAFMIYFKVAIMTGLVISSPFVFYHIWAFIAVLVSWKTGRRGLIWPKAAPVWL